MILNIVYAKICIKFYKLACLQYNYISQLAWCYNGQSLQQIAINTQSSFKYLTVNIYVLFLRTFVFDGQSQIFIPLIFSAVQKEIIKYTHKFLLEIN